MEEQSIPCIALADLFSGIESLIPEFEKPLFYEPFYLGRSKFVTIDVVIDFAEEEPGNESYNLLLHRAQQVPNSVVRF